MAASSMTRSLILYLDETWPDRAECPWVVLDGGNRVAEQGFSGPQHWPAAGACTVVLGGGQCVQHSVRLPKGRRREEHALLRYALEEKLIGDVEHQHFTVIDRSNDHDGALVTVLVIANARLRQLMAELDAIGRFPDRIVSELQTACGQGGRWAVSIGPTGTIILSVPNRHALVVDPGGLRDWLSFLLQKARSRDEMPEGLAIVRAAEGPARQIELPALPDEMTVVETGDYAWWSRLDTGADLLHGGFAVSGRKGGPLKRLRFPALGITLAVLILLVANIVELGLKRQELETLEQRMQRIFETSVPGTPAIAPVAQLRREVDQKLEAHGQLRHDDFLRLLDIATETAGSTIRDQITSIEYAEGVLKLGFAARGNIDVGLLAARLGAAGFIAQQSADNPGSLTLSARRAP